MKSDPDPGQQSTQCRSSTCTCWGYTFQVTPDHLSVEEAEELRASWDVLGDEALSRLNRLEINTSERCISSDKRTTGLHLLHGDKTPETSPEPGQKRDLYRLLRNNAKKDALLSRLWTEVNMVPEWVDWAQIARGQDCFYRYGGPMLTGEFTNFICVFQN